MLDRTQTTLRDGAVSCLVSEAAGPLLHFAHATGFNAETYRGLLTPLEGRLRIVASDARGHGFSTLSAPAGSARDWTIFRDDLLTLLDAIAPEGAILAGHSMGATVSLMAAALRPERVRGLVLIEPVLMPSAARLLMRLAGLLRKPPIGLAERAAKRRDTFPSFDAALSAYRGRGAFSTWQQDTVADYLKGGLVAVEDGVRLACPPAWEAEIFRSAPEGVAHLARRLRCPVTLLHAPGGTASAMQVGLFKRLKWDTRVILQPDATHFLPMEFPDLVRQEILRLAG